MMPWLAEKYDREDYRGLKKPFDPEARLGIYKSLDDVPPRYRLEANRAEYEGRDVWQEWFNAEKADVWKSDTSLIRFRLLRESWTHHVEDRGRHYALARPADVETWTASMLEERTVKTVVGNYWSNLEAFYRWLLYDVEHPHRYNPVWMAAANGGKTADVWAVYVGATPEVPEHE